MMFDGVLADRPIQALKILIDTGASHSFVSQRTVTADNISVDAQQHGSLKVANNKGKIRPETKARKRVEIMGQHFLAN